MQAWIIESLLQFTCVSCFNFRNHTQNNLKLHHSFFRSLIRKHVMHLVKKHRNEYIIYNNSSFLIEKWFLNLPSLLHNLTYLSLLNSFLPLRTFSVFLRSLNNYFFRWPACKSLLSRFSELRSYMWSSNLFFCIQLFSTFFMVQIFQGSCFSRSTF